MTGDEDDGEASADTDDAGADTVDADTTLGLARGTVELVSHDPAWRDASEREVARLRPRLGDDALGFEHVGSTAVPGIAAKPVLDIVVLVSALDDTDAVARTLESAGYEERPGDGVPDRRFFARGPPARRTHYLSVTERGSDCHRDQVDFRDALVSDPALAAEYDARKRELAESYPDDRSSYTAAKASFVEGVLEDVRDD